MSQPSQGAISLRDALESSTEQLLDNLKRYNDTHEDPSEEDVGSLDETVLQRIFCLLRSHVKSETGIFVQALQVVLTLANAEQALQMLLNHGAVEVLNELNSMFDEESKQTDLYYNYLYTMQAFCELEAARNKVGKLFLIAFCNSVHEPCPLVSKRSFIGCVNAMLQGSAENKQLLEKEGVDLRRFVDTMRKCGDHYLQQQIVEFLFRVRKIFPEDVSQLFRDNADLDTAFAEIRGKDGFSESLRSFLFLFNAAQGPAQNVFSLKANEVHIGEEHKQPETWVNFGAEQATFEIRSPEESVWFDLDYKQVRNLKLSDKARSNPQAKFRLRNTPDALREMYDCEKDHWISFVFTNADVEQFSGRVAPIIIAVQKNARKALQQASVTDANAKLPPPPLKEPAAQPVQASRSPPSKVAACKPEVSPAPQQVWRLCVHFPEPLAWGHNYPPQW